MPYACVGHLALLQHTHHTMAGTTITMRQAFVDDHVVMKLIEQVHKLIDDYDALIAKLNSDSGVSDTDYAPTSAAKFQFTDG